MKERPQLEQAYTLPEEIAAGPLEPDFITPVQYQDRVRRDRTEQPELRLMLAVIGDAIATYQGFANRASPRDQQMFDEAERWIRSTNTSWPYSFDRICQALSFDADALRRGLEAWRGEQPHGQERAARLRIRSLIGTHRAMGDR
jgi:hypothetical protein